MNGAAQFNFKGVLNMPLEEWRRQTDIILTGAFLFTKHVAHQMIEQERKGNIINIISTAGHQGEPGNVGYGTAKAGLLNFTRSVAMELVRLRHPGQQPDPDSHDAVGGTGAGRTVGRGDWPGHAWGSAQRDCCRTPAEALPCSSCPARRTTARRRSSWPPTTRR